VTTSTLESSTELAIEATERSLWITRHDGTPLDLATVARDQLRTLQWQEETAFARLIEATPKNSSERARTVAQAYDTVCTILGRITNPTGGPLDMGFDRRYVQLVLRVLSQRTQNDGRRPRVFEIGYGSGSMLAALAEQGVDVGGIEVSQAMRDRACARMPESCRDGLLVGSYLEHQPEAVGYDVVYWNDVLEHLVPDEVPDFLGKIYAELAPGGALITLTPNWYHRPSDITGLFRPLRSTAEGFHLKEYTLRETTAALRAAGFAQVGTPLFVTRRQIVVCGQGLAALKRLCEPALEFLPYRLTKLLCRGFGLSCTIARKV
jgi:2-polyprenyl-3-methyl-5-hydroxy-6-metoxy-1,4-benzoquinol methylase